MEEGKSNFHKKEIQFRTLFQDKLKKYNKSLLNKIASFEKSICNYFDHLDMFFLLKERK